MSEVYVCPDPNEFCFWISNSVTLCSKLEPWNLWTVDAHADVKGNLVRLMDGDTNTFLSHTHVS